MVKGTVFAFVVKPQLHEGVHYNNYRLSYALWMLQLFHQQIAGKPIKLYLMYDIACVLDKHLQVN